MIISSFSLIFTFLKKKLEADELVGLDDEYCEDDEEGEGEGETEDEEDEEFFS